MGLAIGATAGNERVTVGVGRTAQRGDAPDNGTIFQIGSVTKVLTCLLLADAVLRGEVALDQPLATLIPETATHPSGRPITLEDLATHSSGLPRLPPGLARQALRNRQDPYASLTTTQLVAALARTPRRTPGTAVRYSNFGAGMLGEALSRAGGSSYESLVISRIAQPLGMHDTVVHGSAEQHGRRAVGHSRRRRPVPDWQLPAMPAAGALRSTMTDLLALLDAHLRPERSPMASAIRLAIEPRIAAGRRLRVGLGWHVLARKDAADWWWHNGGTGGYFSIVAVDPFNKAAVAVLTNTARSVDRLGMKILDHLTRTPAG